METSVNLLSKVKAKLSSLVRKDSYQRWEEEYLSGAVDLYDLERRQKRLERGEVASPVLWHLNTHNTKGQ
jgi:predicted RNA-binding protein with EMAP domain